MKGLTKKGIDLWNDRVDEVIKAVPADKERAKEIRSMFPPKSDAEIEQILREYHRS